MTPTQETALKQYIGLLVVIFTLNLIPSFPTYTAFFVLSILFCVYTIAKNFINGEERKWTWN